MPEVTVNPEQLRDIPRGQRFQYLIEQGMEAGAARAAIEKLRGITRNSKGQIVWTKAQINERIAHFTSKAEDMTKRRAKALAKIKDLKALKAKMK